jgi:hypothetical protein
LRWCRLHKGTVNSSLILRPKALGWAKRKDGYASTGEARKPGNLAKVAGIPKTLDFTSEQFALVYARG